MKYQRKRIKQRQGKRTERKAIEKKEEIFQNVVTKTKGKENRKKQKFEYNMN